MDDGIQIEIPMESIKAICAKWKIREFGVFGSVLRRDFRPDSDIDVLVSFEPGAGWSLWDLFDLQDELESLLGRRVDLIEKEALRNPFRRHEILSTRRVLYAA
ncbi:MAG TPA: nucleotidyltransferase family protein [Phycisphaerae bacterium]|nr:nucleotidyltransferase family protein [Phycisphaerae bacterium]